MAQTSSDGDLLRTTLSSSQGFLQLEVSTRPEALHPCTGDFASNLKALQTIVNTTQDATNALHAHQIQEYSDPKLLSLLRQQSALQNTLGQSQGNVKLAAQTFRKHAGKAYSLSVPTESAARVQWVLWKLEAWGEAAGMEIFREEKDGHTSVVMGGKVLVVDVELTLDRPDPQTMAIDVSTVKTSFAFTTNTVSSVSSSGTSSLDVFLKQELHTFIQLTQAQPLEQKDVTRLTSLDTRLRSHLQHLMQLDRLANQANDLGMLWFELVDKISSVTGEFATSEAKLVSSSLQLTRCPLDIFLRRAHALPLSYLSNPSASFLVSLSPMAYLRLLADSRNSDELSPENSFPFDISLSHLHRSLNSDIRQQGVLVADLILDSTASSYSPPLDISPSSAIRPIFNFGDPSEVLVLPQTSSSLPGLTSGKKDGATWFLDFTNGGNQRGVVMTRTRMTEIFSLVDPGHVLPSIPAMSSFIEKNWVETLVDLNGPTSGSYFAAYESPSSAHPPLRLELAAPEDDVFILERVPVSSMGSIWAILEVVREQCWINDIISSCSWSSTGHPLVHQDDRLPMTETDLEAVMNGSFKPSHLPIQVSLPTSPLSDSLLPQDTFRDTQQAGKRPPAQIVMTGPIWNSSEPMQITVSHNVANLRGVKVTVNGPITVDTSKLEEFSRRGGTLGLCGVLWNSQRSAGP